MGEKDMERDSQVAEILEDYIPSGGVDGEAGPKQSPTHLMRSLGIRGTRMKRAVRGLARGTSASGSA